MFRRPLWYPRDWGEPACVERPREKGIDVSLAIDMVELALDGAYEVGILFSRDNDLLPPIELVRKRGGVHIEVASWQGASKLFLPADGKHKKLWCHVLTEADFNAVRLPKGYGGPPSR